MSHGSWLLTPKPNAKAAMRLICFPYAGGSASTYLSWSKWLPCDVELVAVQPPGRASRLFEPCYSDMTALTNELMNVMRSVINSPYILFGHSLGGLVAYALMEQCRAEGLPLPVHFIASGCRAPQLGIGRRQVSQLPDREFIAELRKLNGTPDEVLDNQELMSIRMPALRADFKIAECYMPVLGSRFSCPASILAGTADINVSGAELAAWADLFSGKPSIIHIEGDHFFVETNALAMSRHIVSIIEAEREHSCAMSASVRSSQDFCASDACNSDVYV